MISANVNLAEKRLASHRVLGRIDTKMPKHIISLSYLTNFRREDQVTPKGERIILALDFLSTALEATIWKNAKKRGLYGN